MNLPTLPGTDGQTPLPAGFRSGFVALAGRPNVGKSTLLNRLIGTKISIVSPVPQTTRMVIRAVARSAAAEIVYVDTPGIHRPQHAMNQEMVEAAREALSGADLVLQLIDGAEGFGPGDGYLVRILAEASLPAFLVINKIDAMRRSALLPLIDDVRRRHEWSEIHPCSALTGEGCGELEDSIRALLPEGPPLFPADFVTDLPTRLALAEIIREQLLLRTRDEIPHATAVMVDSLERSETGDYRIAATIYVDRDSQKGIVIGKAGTGIKAIGATARMGMAAFLGAPAHLSLWVKVKRGWRNEIQLLRLLGISGRG